MEYDLTDISHSASIPGKLHWHDYNFMIILIWNLTLPFHCSFRFLQLSTFSFYFRKFFTISWCQNIVKNRKRKNISHELKSKVKKRNYKINIQVSPTANLMPNFLVYRESRAIRHSKAYTVTHYFLIRLYIYWKQYIYLYS